MFFAVLKLEPHPNPKFFLLSKALLAYLCIRKVSPLALELWITISFRDILGQRNGTAGLLFLWQQIWISHPKSVYFLECKMKDLVMESARELHWYGYLYSLSLCSSHLELLSFIRPSHTLPPWGLCALSFEKSFAQISIFVNWSPRLKATFQIKFFFIIWAESVNLFSVSVLVSYCCRKSSPFPTPRKF